MARFTEKSNRPLPKETFSDTANRSTEHTVNSKTVQDILQAYAQNGSQTDPMGSWTGQVKQYDSALHRTEIKKETPVQDADDL